MLLYDSLDSFNTVANGGNWDTIAGSTMSVVSSPKIEGTGSLFRDGTSSNTTVVRKNFVAGTRLVWVEFYYRLSHQATINNLNPVIEVFNTNGDALGIDQLRPG